MKTFKQHLTESVNVGDIVTIKYKDLIVDDENMCGAAYNISVGQKSFDTKISEVHYYPKRKKFDLANGHHRLIESMLRGEVKNKFKVTDIYDSKRNCEFQFDKNLPYKGLENLERIESYTLRDL